jgi:Zn finger protein HypA/HybF involved in hydrogenase expression
MIEYIYFVKCPNCDDEPFNFFNDAKDFALGCLSKKPVITQTEVCRNDFGECTDSSDLGTIWSWEDMMKDVPADDPEISIFTKDDFGEYDPDQDPEFSEISNLLDDIPDNFRKPVPADMTIDALVEEMEENEDTVECKWCNELFDKSEVHYEVDLGYLCPQCEAAIKSRGETLTFKEGPYDDDSLNETFDPKETVELFYDNLTSTITGPKRDVDDWDEAEYSDSYTYDVSKEDVATTIWENFITEEDVADIPGGLEALEDDSAWNRFLETHFDILFEKYYDQLLKHYEDDAVESFENSVSWDDINESKTKSMLEELEEPDAYHEHLTFCPECGSNSFDVETGICINCGFNTFSLEEELDQEDIKTITDIVNKANTEQEKNITDNSLKHQENIIKAIQSEADYLADGTFKHQENVIKAVERENDLTFDSLKVLAKNDQAIYNAVKN